MRLVIVLPRGARFDVQRPTSIETVVRTLIQSTARADRPTIVCERHQADTSPGPARGRAPAKALG